MRYVRFLFLSLAVCFGGLVEAMTGVVSSYALGDDSKSYGRDVLSSLSAVSEALAPYEQRLTLLQKRTEEVGGLMGMPIGFSAPEFVGGLDHEVSATVHGLAERLINLDRQMQKVDSQSESFSAANGQIVARVANAIRGFPVEQGFISSPFGVRKDPFGSQMKHHKGLDIAADPGSDVIATAPGTVYAAAWMKGFGNAVIVDHAPGGVQTIYAHLGDIRVTRGETVSRGAVLGSVGSSGRSTGPHIHYEIRLANSSVDPLPFLYR